MRARSIGMLFQQENLVGHLTVEQNLRVTQALARGRRARRRARELLAEVGLEAKADAMPRRLSGGELARAGLAVAIANEPPVILADEPTGELDEENERLVLYALRELETTVVVVTHSERVAAAVDRVIEMRDGRVAR